MIAFRGDATDALRHSMRAGLVLVNRNSIEAFSVQQNASAWPAAAGDVRRPADESHSRTEGVLQHFQRIAAENSSEAGVQATAAQ